jgi:hypothetical protein
MILFAAQRSGRIQRHQRLLHGPRCDWPKVREQVETRSREKHPFARDLLAPTTEEGAATMKSFRRVHLAWAGL